CCVLFVVIYVDWFMGGMHCSIGRMFVVFLKQKRACGIRLSRVVSEMCIRDSPVGAEKRAK
ncbi:MAG: hypothetical protein MPK62_03925, partial [Alphaproteobacteria bacterium]|nr:hypothetical protein [Alphaproteobacteria bacterium]